jgi:hypothetical protein
MSDGNYAIRYRVEDWNKPRENVEEKPIRPGIIVSKDDYGYTDRLFLASIIYGDGEDREPSVMLLDSVDGPTPSKEILELIKGTIEHYLKHHVKK